MIEKIMNTNENNIEEVVKNKIAELDDKSNNILQLGFIDALHSNSIHKGFIPLNTRIRYSNHGVESYSMKTTDFIFEFIKLIKKYNLVSKWQIIRYLEHYINSYFGLPGRDNREKIFYDTALNSTSTDDELFEALEKNEIGMLKNKQSAQCTERSAVAEQILSVLGFEIFYCMGCVDLGNSHQEPHCFNIIKRQNDYALVDYSCPVTEYNEDNSIRDYYPFVAILSNEEFIEFLNNGVIKKFTNYCFESKNGKSIMVTEDSNRSYVVGKYEIKRENQK